MPSVIAIALACGLATEAHLLAAIVSVESGGNPIALQVNGAMELMRQPRDQAASKL
jgi:type IV secretion system protein VirB1